MSLFFGEPVGIRTRDLLIKSQLLYRLSYGLYDFSSMRYKPPTLGLGPSSNHIATNGGKTLSDPPQISRRGELSKPASRFCHGNDNMHFKSQTSSSRHAATAARHCAAASPRNFLSVNREMRCRWRLKVL
jgi:hypothetical protein